MKCKHCGSSYTHFVENKGNADKVVEVYHCDSCNQDFEHVKQTSSAADKWIMTLYGLEQFGDYGDITKIVKKPDGTIVCQQKMTKDYKTSFNQYATVPDLTIKYADGMFPGYQLWYSSFRWPNDPNGNLFIVSKVEYGPELAKLAKEQEALRILASNHYLKGTIKDPAALKDAVVYLRDALGTQPVAESSGGGGGCYVATCVYGSYDCPQVWTLRRYRDNTLARTWYGRAFVSVYYAVSPTLVKWFGHTEWFKRMWQSKLDRMVGKLQANGVESTPYEDRNW